MDAAKVLQALKAIGDGIVDAVRAAGPMGCPGGTLYAALMTQGCTLQQFESIMSGLVRAGKLRKSNNLYFVV